MILALLLVAQGLLAVHHVYTWWLLPWLPFLKPVGPWVQRQWPGLYGLNAFLGTATW
jgi:hypothetical protein